MVKSAGESDIQISVVSDQDAFGEMADDWKTLVQQASASVFLSWEWHYTWWQVYSTPKDRLYVVRFTQNGELVGILPMYSRAHGVRNQATLRFLGTGEPREHEVATEYLDVIARADVAETVANRAIDWLKSCEQWGKVELRFMLDDAHLVKAYNAREDVHFVERNVGFRYRACLAAGEVDFLEKLDKSRAKRIKRSGRAIERDGGLQQHSVTNIDELSSSFKQLAELNHERQAHKDRKSVFTSDKFDRFHRSLFERAFDQGMVNIHQFKLQNSLLAVIYCFYDDKTCYYYQSGFAKRMANKYMPLTFAHLAEMERNRGKGMQYYDLMRGEPPTYKDDFGCETTPMVTTFVFCSKSALVRFETTKAVRRAVVRLLSSAGIRRTRS